MGLDALSEAKTLIAKWRDRVIDMNISIKNVFGESFQRFLIVSAEMTDQLQTKEKRTNLENDFIKVFEEIGEIITGTKFQKYVSSCKRDISNSAES